MTIYSSKAYIIILGLWMSCLVIYGQDGNTAGADTQFILDIDTQNRWSHNFGLMPRFNFARSADMEIRPSFIEVSHFSNYEIGFYSKLGAGIRYRFKNLYDPENKNELRLIQHYNYPMNFNAVKTEHRVMLEEHFSDDFTLRPRYRFLVEIPLEGQNIDTKEFFLVTSTEALVSFTEVDQPLFEHRITAFFGNNLTKYLQIVLGLDYSHIDYTRSPKGSFFIVSGLQLRI